MSDKRVITPEEVLAAMKADRGRVEDVTNPRSKSDIYELLISHLGIKIERQTLRMGKTQNISSQLAETVNVASITRSLNQLVEAGEVVTVDLAAAKRVRMSTWNMRDHATYYVLADRFNEAVTQADKQDRNRLYATLRREAEKHILMTYESEVDAEYKTRCAAHGLDTSVETITQGDK